MESSVPVSTSGSQVCFQTACGREIIITSERVREAEEKLKAISESFDDTRQLPCIEFDRVSQPGSRLDTVGIVESIDGSSFSLIDETETVIKIQMQNLDHGRMEEEVIRVGNVIACRNLKWHICCSNFKSAIAGQDTIFDANPNDPILAESIRIMKELQERVPAKHGKRKHLDEDENREGGERKKSCVTGSETGV